MKKIMFTIFFAGMLAFLFSQATELFISEYIEGSSYNKAIEIFNGIGADVDLSQYSLEKDVNGNGVWGNTYNYAGILADGDVFVLAHPSADPQILAVANATNGGVINFNGNDQVRLVKNGVEIDRFGEPGGANFAIDVTMVRRDDVASPTTTWNTDEWLSYPINTFSYLGYHVFQNEDPLIYVTSPNGGEQWEQGSSHMITWESYNFDDDVMIELENPINRSREVLVASTENDGEWQWSIPPDQPLSDYYVIVISEAVTGDPSDMSDNPFSIVEPVQVLELTIYEIQNSQAGPSPYVGELVQTNGVVTAIFTNYFFIQDGPGEWNGIAVYPMQAVQIGDNITISGEVIEYMDKTEISNIINLTVNGTSPLPPAVTISTATLAAEEEYESVLVRLQNVTVVQEANAYNEWLVDDGSGECMIGGLGAYTYVPVLDDFIYSITGVVDYTYGSFKLQPRDDNDFNFAGLIIEPLVLNFFSYDACVNGLEFSISNLSNEAVTINDLTSSGAFASGNPWEIEDFSLSLPYDLAAGSTLNFNVVVGLPVDYSAREIISDVIEIDAQTGFTEITLNFETALNVNAHNNPVSMTNELIGNYPNPFNPVTFISYNLAKSSRVVLSIYNLRGQKINTLVDDHQPAGLHQVAWQGSAADEKSVSSGVYFYELWTEEGDYTCIKKMILLK